MKTLGNPKFLRAEIEKRYSEKIAKVVEEGKKEVAALKEESTKKAETVRSSNKGKIDKDAQIAYDTAFNEVITEAKKDFELFQEQKYEEIFSEILASAETICGQKEFLSWVSDFVKDLPGKVNIRCSKSAVAGLKKTKASSVVAEKDLAGAYVEAEGTTYDLTLATLLDTKRDFLRRIISDELSR